MNNNLRKIEKELRAFAKRCKDIKYNVALLFSFLVTGSVSLTANGKDEVETARKGLQTSITDMKKLFKEAKAENNKLMKGSNLELIQLMEQGDHVVKSPWSSWQYGMNYFYSDWRGTYKGIGDKKEKYPYEGIFRRGEWWERNVTPTGYAYSLLNQGETDLYSASTTKRNGLLLNGYGLIERNAILEPTNELELGASIRPKAVTRTPVAVAAPAGPTGTGPALPDVNIPKFNPAAPEINVPTPGVAPVFNIELGAFCNDMESCAVTTNAGFGFVRGGGTIGTPKSYGNVGNVTANLANDPALRYSWNFSDTVSGRNKGQWRLLKVHFDVVGSSGVTIENPLDIDSINPLTASERTAEQAAGRAFNNQEFLVGGSRIATLDNARNNSYIRNNSTLNLKGPLVIGLEMQYDRLGDATDRTLYNKGIITDASEAADTTIGNVAKGGTIDLDLGLYGWNTTPPTNLSNPSKTTFYRNLSGYFGAKIGMILTLEDDSVAAATKKYVTKNETGGKIEFHGDKSIGIQIYSPVKNTTPKIEILNEEGATISTSGIESYGIKVSSAVDATNSSVVNKGKIEVSGHDERAAAGTVPYGKSAGIAVLEDPNMDDSAFTAIQAGNMVKNEGKINISGTGNTGLFLKTNFEDTFTNASTGKINLSGDYNIGMRIDKGTVSGAAGNVQTGVNSGNIKIEEGSNNIGMFANGATANVTNDGIIEIAGGSSNAGMMSKIAGSKPTNNKTITVSGGTGNLGMYIDTGLTGYSGATSKIEVTGGSKNAGLVNFGTYNMNGSTIIAEGENSIGVYSKGTSSSTKLNGNIESKKGAVAMFAEDSEMELENLTAKVGDTGLLFYNYTLSGGNYTPTGKFNIKNNVNATIEKGGVAFYNVGAIGSESTFLNMLHNAGGALNLTMREGGRLFVFNQPGLTVNLSSIPTQPVGGTINLNNANGEHVVSITGNKYKYYTVNKATLNLDQQVNLNDENDKFHSLDFISSNVNINSLMTNNGANIANNLTYAVAQGNSGSSVNDLKVTNNSTVDLTNQAGLTAIVTDFGTIENTVAGIVNNTGDNGIGLLGINGSVVSNLGTITVGNGGAALYGINNLNPAVTTGDINLTNDGVINSTGTTAASYGVVAKNHSAISTVTLGGNSQINFGNNPGGVGVYTENTTINNNGGTITLGTNGVGIQGVNSTLNLVGGIITSTATGAKGVYSNQAFTNTGTTVNLTGDNSTGLFSAVSVANNGTVKVGDSSNPSSPSIAIYAPTATNSGTVESGVNSIGIYSNGTTNVDLQPGSALSVGSGGTGVYKDGGIVNVNNGTTLNIAPNNAIGVFGVDATVNNYHSEIGIGNSSIGFAVKGTSGVFNSVAGTTQTLGEDTIYAYSREGATINNNTIITSSGNANVALYGDGSNVNNNAVLNLQSGIGNVGILNINGGTGINNAPITIGKSNSSADLYSIGMAAKDGAQIYNNSTITVTGNKGIGMYGAGAGTVVENRAAGRIVLDASGASSSNRIEQMTGMFLDDGALGRNYGDIITAGNYAGNSHVNGMIGVVVNNRSTFENYGNIKINADSGYGMYVYNSIIKNYGTIEVEGGGTKGVYFRNSKGIDETTPLTIGNVDGQINGTDPLGSPTGGKVIANGGATPYEAITYDPTKSSGGITLKKDVDGKVKAFDENGNIIPTEIVNNIPEVQNFAFSNIGVYVDTLGRTKPITGSGYAPTGTTDIIIGIEAAEKTNAKAIKIGNNILKPFLDTNPSGKLKFYSGSLTWQATYDEGDVAVNGDETVLMAKYPYTKYANDSDLYNFTDGLEQRYGMNELDSREKVLFNKLNSIGDNEDILLSQAFDEMMGHQYANVQQRTHGTGRLIDKEITHLSKEWDTKSKQSNKIKVFGMRDEYNTDTAGIIDYNSHAYGFAYLHEDETVKLGNSSGWYAGAVHNRFKFKDIGRSSENQTMLKLGIFKTMSPVTDHNGSLQWTISGEGYVSRNDMHRKYLVVDEIFNAKSDYTAYGVALKNELGYNIRTSERTSIRPYGSLKLEYGRFGSIKEKSGEIRLEVKGNDYYSVKPEVGIEFRYKQPMAVKTTFVTSLGLGYENELGKVGDVKNKARVAYTNADWFNIRGEKDDRKGNFKADLNLGIENQRFGVTFNAGYDTKGKNVRGGLGFRVIY